MGVQTFPPPSSRVLARRVDAFTTSGTWTCPSGVTYATARIRAGGGGGGGVQSVLAAAGGSSAAFGFTATGGRPGAPFNNDAAGAVTGSSAPANSGEGGGGCGRALTSSADARQGVAGDGGRGTEIEVGSAVTPGTGYTITVGSGGAGGTSGGAGGSGVVWIEYEVSA